MCGLGLGDKDLALSESDSSQSDMEDPRDAAFDENVRPEETVYRENELEELGQVGRVSGLQLVIFVLEQNE